MHCEHFALSRSCLSISRNAQVALTAKLLPATPRKMGEVAADGRLRDEGERGP